MQVNDYQQAYNEYTQHIRTSLRRKHLSRQELSDLVKSYRQLKHADMRILSMKIDEVAARINQEAETLTSNFTKELLEKYDVTFSSDYNHFSKLRILDTISIPSITGLRACAYIPLSQKVILGFEEGGQGSLGMLDLQSKMLVSILSRVHKKVICRIVWIEKTSLVVTASYKDELVKVHRVIPEKKQMSTISVFRAHTKHVNALVYLSQEKLLLSADQEGNIRIWNPRNIRNIGVIFTKSSLLQSDHLTYIASEKLVVVAVDNHLIILYHIYKRNMVGQVDIKPQMFGLNELRYLPRKKLLITGQP